MKRALFCLITCVLVAGCRDKGGGVMPTSNVKEANPEQLAALHAGNVRLAARLTQQGDETKKLPETLEALQAWATANKAWDAEDEKALVDPWGNRVVYKEVVTIGRTFTIRSMGPDGKDKTTDDLTYDSRDKKTMTFKQRNG